jgi:Zn-dependent peptidase ImmA (M78 family)
MAVGGIERSVLARLRAQRWGYRYGGAQATIKLAERQAALLLSLTGNDARTVDQAIRELPRIVVLEANIPTSGLSLWDGHQWLITLNRREPPTRQRFTLLHEYKHIVDHPSVEWLYRDRSGGTAVQQAERAADYFAGCALVPEQLLIDAWNAGLRRHAALAKHFAVSTHAIKVRLVQVGLLVSSPAPDRPPPPDLDGRTVSTAPEDLVA